MQRILSSRPPTVSSKPTSLEALPERGRYTFNIFGSDLNLPVWPLGVLIFLVIGMYGLLGYISFPHVYPISQEVSQTITNAPSLFSEGNDSYASIPMLLRSLSITLGLGLAIGVTKYLGNIEKGC